MDWEVVLPRFRQLLMPGCYLALINAQVTPDPWSILQEIITLYRTDGGYQPYNMLEELARHGLFRQVGRQETAPISFTQSIDDYIESYHSRSGFSRQRMGAAQAMAFDQAAREILLATYPTGVITLQIAARVIWGLPGEGC